MDYDFGWETESDEDEGDSPKSAEHAPSPAKPKRTPERPAVRPSCLARDAGRAHATRSLRLPLFQPLMRHLVTP